MAGAATLRSPVGNSPWTRWSTWRVVAAPRTFELTHEELQRSARFSADASHQLKTPVTVLRVGLEELLAH